MTKTDFESKDGFQRYHLKGGDGEMAQSEEPKKYYCLSRDFRARKSFQLYELDAADEESAWKEIEDGIETNMSQDWLITAEEVRIIRELLARIP